MIPTSTSIAQPGASINATIAAVSRSEAALLLLAQARNAAYAEAAQGRLGQGLHLLHDALQQEPMSHELLSDIAALLLAAGELEPAAGYARRALDLQAEHGASLYTLAFALSGLGEAGEALTMLSRLVQEGDAAESLLREAPELMPLALRELDRLMLRQAHA